MAAGSATSGRRSSTTGRYLRHGQIVALTMVGMVILYGLSILVLWNVLTDEQLKPVLVVMIPMMVFQFANAALLLPDLDHQRFRLALSFAPKRLTEEVLKDTSDRTGRSLFKARDQLRQVDDRHWHEVSQALRERSIVERSVPTLVRVVVGLAAVILGALLGNWFAEAFQPPPVPPGAERYLKVGVIVIVALSMLIIAHSLRALWTLDQRTIETARRLASQPLADFYQRWRWTDRLSKKFLDDVEMTVELAFTPTHSMKYIVKSRRSATGPASAFSLDTSSSTSLGLLQFGLGLIFGAIFQVFI